MVRKYLVTEDELLSAHVTEAGELTFTRDNGEVVNAGLVKGDQGDQGVPGPNTIPTEEVIADSIAAKILDGSGDRLVAVDDADYRLPDPVLQAIAADVGDVATDVGAAIEGRTFVIDTDYANLEDALAAVPVGGVLEVRGAWSRSTAFVVNKACTVRFNNDGAITVTSASVSAIVVTANRVTLDAPRLLGTGSGTAGTGTGISSVGTVSVTVKDLRIIAPYITGFSKYGIYLEHVHRFRIERPRIEDIAYSGITTISCFDGVIDGGSVKALTMPTGFVNAYGIALTRNSGQSMAVSPRTTRVTVNNVTIDGVPWEGIDTHAGEFLTITNNTVTNCAVGIAIVGCPNPEGVDSYGPKNVLCTGNTVSGSTAQGIKVVGAGGAVGTVVEAASAVVVANNTITDCGDEANLTGSGAIIAYNTQGCVISGNTLIRPGAFGFYLYYANKSLVLANNIVEDAWSNGQTWAGAIFARSGYNEVTVSGLQIARGAKTATHVNERGLSIATATASTVVDAGGNQWANATVTPISGGTTVIKAGVYGVPPVARPAAIASPTADVAALKTAVDLLRAAIQNYGITL